MIAKNKHIDLCMPADELEFGNGYNLRVHHTLHACKVETVLDLCKMQRNELFRFRDDFVGVWIEAWYGRK